MPGIWDDNDARGILHGSNTRIIHLANFPTQALMKKADPHSAASRNDLKRTYKRLRDNVLRWIYRLEDRGLIRCRNGGTIGLGIGSWVSNYEAAHAQGTYTATIVGLGSKSAMLIANLTESVRLTETKAENCRTSGSTAARLRRARSGGPTWRAHSARRRARR